MMNAITQRDYYCWHCQTFALAGGRAIWCEFFESWMHVLCHDAECQGGKECYEQQVIPMS